MRDLATLDYATFKRWHRLLHSPNRVADWKQLQIEVLEYQLANFPKLKKDDQNAQKGFRISQRFIDSIFWMHVEYELPDVRRIYQNGTKIQNLHEANLVEHLKFLNGANEKENVIVLYADLATHIDIGDFVCLIPDTSLFFPVEFKSGSVNERILQALKQEALGQSSLVSTLTSDPKLKEQTERMRRQLKRLEHALTAYVENESVIPVSPSHPKGGQLKILTSELHTSSYEAELLNLISTSQKTGFAQATVDSCLEVAVIINLEGLEKFKVWANSQTFDGINVNLASFNNEETFSRPLMSLSLEPEVIWRIICGEISVLMFFSMQKFMNTFAGGTVSYKAVRGKKLRRLLARPPAERPFVFGDYAVSVIDDDRGEFHWSIGMLHRLFGSLQTPDTLHRLQEFMNSKI